MNDLRNASGEILCSSEWFRVDLKNVSTQRYKWGGSLAPIEEKQNKSVSPRRVRRGHTSPCTAGIRWRILPQTATPGIEKQARLNRNRILGIAFHGTKVVSRRRIYDRSYFESLMRFRRTNCLIKISTSRRGPRSQRLS